MRRLRFVFKKAKKDGEFLDDGIALYTRCIPMNWFSKFYFCHVEMEFVERGVCFSSTMQDPWSGVRFAPTNEVIVDRNRWEGFEILVPDYTEEHLYFLAQGEVGKKYDVPGLTTGFFFAAAFLQNDAKRYCSDICGWLATCLGIFRSRYWILSPIRMAELLQKKLGRPPMPYSNLIVVSQEPPQ